MNAAIMFFGINVYNFLRIDFCIILTVNKTDVII